MGAFRKAYVRLSRIPGMKRMQLHAQRQQRKLAQKIPRTIKSTIQSERITVPGWLSGVQPDLIRRIPNNRQ